MLLPNSVQVTESISGSVVPLAMFPKCPFNNESNQQWTWELQAFYQLASPTPWIGENQLSAMHFYFVHVTPWLFCRQLRTKFYCRQSEEFKVWSIDINDGQTYNLPTIIILPEDNGQHQCGLPRTSSPWYASTPNYSLPRPVFDWHSDWYSDWYSGKHLVNWGVFTFIVRSRLPDTILMLTPDQEGKS